MAYSTAYQPFTWHDRNVSNPMTFSVTGAVTGTITLTEAETEIDAGTAFTAARMQQIENGINAVGVAMVAAQQDKITNDSGYVLHSVTSGDLLAAILTWGAGLNTFSASAGVTYGSGQTLSGSVWGLSYMDNAGAGGWMWFVGSQGNIFTNNIVGNAWAYTTSQQIVQSNLYNRQLQIQASDFLLTCTGFGDIHLKASSTVQADLYYASGCRLRVGSDAGGIHCLNNSTGGYVTITASGFPIGSKRETKTNIKPIDKNVLNTVINTKVYEYDLKSALESNSNYSKFIGLIYEEVPTEIHGSEDGIDIYRMCSILWKAVQELTAKVEVLESKI